MFGECDDDGWFRRWWAHGWWKHHQATRAPHLMYSQPISVYDDRLLDRTRPYVSRGK